jgi:hypothetical protein
MSVLALALKRLALSQGTVPKDCPNGTAPEARTGTLGTAGTVGTLGTIGPVGTRENETERDALRCPMGQSLRDVPMGHHAEAADRLRAYPCPDGFSPARWRCLQDGAVGFAEEWGARALALGWTEAELFAFAEPFSRVDIQGASWFIGDSNVAAVTADAITLRTESGSTLRLYRRG